MKNYDRKEQAMENYDRQQDGGNFGEVREDGWGGGFLNGAPEYAAQAGDDAEGQEPNDASDPLGGTPSPEYGEQAGAGVDENDIESADHVKTPYGSGAAAKRRDAAHERELAYYDTYEALADFYKEIFNNLPDAYRIPGAVDYMNKLDLKSSEFLDTYEELKAATKRLLDQRDFQQDYEDELEWRYGEKLAGNIYLKDYENLASSYRAHFMILNDDAEPDMTGLDTYQRLKIAYYEVLQQRDNIRFSREYEQPIEEKDESHMDDSDELPAVDYDKDALKGYYRDVGDENGAGRTDEPANDPVAKETVKTASSGHDPGEDGADYADEPVNDPVVENTVKTVSGHDAGDNEIEMSPDYVGRVNIGHSRPVSEDEAREKELPEGGEIRMSSEYAGQAGAIDTQEQSTFEAAPEQSVPSTEAQWSVDQDELLNPYEDDPSPISEDELLNPYEDEEGPIPKDQLLNPYEDDPSSIPEDELLNPYEDDPVIDP